jgi:hypothetical protein
VDVHTVLFQHYGALLQRVPGLHDAGRDGSHRPELIRVAGGVWRVLDTIRPVSGIAQTAPNR